MLQTTSSTVDLSTYLHIHITISNLGLKQTYKPCMTSLKSPSSTDLIAVVHIQNSSIFLLYKKIQLGLSTSSITQTAFSQKVLKNFHCANFRVCSKRQVFYHLFSTCCIKVWNYWLKKTTTNFTMLSVQAVLLVSQYRIYIYHSQNLYVTYIQYVL